MIRKWIEKIIEARVNEYLNRVSLMLDEEEIAEHVEVDPALVAEHIEASDLVEYIDLDDALGDAVDYDRIASEVSSYDIAQELDLRDIAEEVDKYDLACHIDSDDIASNISVDEQDVAEHIDLAYLADYVAGEDELISALVRNDDFVWALGEHIQDRVANTITDTMNHLVSENAKKVNAIIEALTLLEDAFSGAIVQLRWAIEGDDEE